MRIESSMAVFLDDSGAVSITQLTEQSGLSQAEVQMLVECGALEPRDATASGLRFSSGCVSTARMARRLRDEFALDDAHAVALLFRFVQRIEELERQLRALK